MHSFVCRWPGIFPSDFTRNRLLYHPCAKMLLFWSVDFFVTQVSVWLSLSVPNLTQPRFFEAAIVLRVLHSSRKLVLCSGAGRRRYEGRPKYHVARGLKKHISNMASMLAMLRGLVLDTVFTEGKEQKL